MSVLTDLITAQAVAEALNLSVDTVWKYTRENKIPFVKLGSKQYRYRLGDVVAALSGAVQEGKPAYQEEGSPRPSRAEILAEDHHEPVSGILHQRVSRRLQRILEEYFRALEPTGEVFNAPLDVRLQDTLVQPDLFYISPHQAGIIKSHRVEGAPHLVVEITTPQSRTRDKIKKLQIYQRAGVKHYWVADPENQTFECFALVNNTYSVAALAAEQEVLSHPHFPGLAVALAQLWP